ncbi:MAG: M48 family metalloprotease [Victivallales bacterium]|nr:M48 family metalloprotease [Victivallales bacterium]
MNNVRSALLLAVFAAVVFFLGVLLGRALGNTEMGVGIALVLVAVMIPIQLVTANAAIKKITRGRPANPNVPKERHCQEIIARLAGNAELPVVPPLYVSASRSPNAFASGLSPKSAFVCVTQGLLDTMNEHEIAGVIGHELGHVKHGDIKLNTLIAGLLSSALLLATGVYYLSGGGRSRSSRSERDGGLLLIVALLLQPLVSLLGQLLQMAISRRREYAADAFAAKVNGQADGIADALEVLQDCERGMTRRDVQELGGNALASMYISFPGFGALFATHPPLAERIRRLRNMQV